MHLTTELWWLALCALMFLFVYIATIHGPPRPAGLAIGARPISVRRRGRSKIRRKCPVAIKCDSQSAAHRGCCLSDESTDGIFAQHTAHDELLSGLKKVYLSGKSSANRDHDARSRSDVGDCETDFWDSRFLFTSPSRIWGSTRCRRASAPRKSPDQPQRHVIRKESASTGSRLRKPLSRWTSMVVPHAEHSKRSTCTKSAESLAPFMTTAQNTRSFLETLNHQRDGLRSKKTWTDPERLV
jgi:hypothetical protein